MTCSDDVKLCDDASRIKREREREKEEYGWWYRGVCECFFRYQFLLNIRPVFDMFVTMYLTGKCLYLSGLVPEPMTCMDDVKLPDFGVGFTNIVGRTTRGSADLKR